VSTASRHAYRDRLVALMAAHPRLVCLDTDTGLFAGVDFAAASLRYLDLGIAEHTAMGAAAALAADGWMPFVNTMATFASTRALESVKINIAGNRLPVRIMATHGGVAAAHLGATHYALEDLAIMRTLPHLTVVVPADAAAAASVVDQSLDLDGPLYVRLGRKATPDLPEGLPGVQPAVIGQIQRLRDGADVVIVCCGPHPVLAALQAAQELALLGISAGVLNAHTIQPLDRLTLLRAVVATTLVITVEEHGTQGGLGGAVAEVLAETTPRRVLRVGLPATLEPGAGSQDDILERHGLRPSRIAALARTALESTALESTALEHTSSPTRSTP
jgi:transketolase